MAIPNLPPEVLVGLPSDLLRRRPDIRVAERQLAAATAQVGSAIADLFPKFFLTGRGGSAEHQRQRLDYGGSRYWSIGPTITLADIRRRENPRQHRNPQRAAGAGTDPV